MVPHNTVNLLGRDILQKLRIQLAQTQKAEKIFNINQKKPTNRTQSIEELLSPLYPNGPVKKPHSQVDIQTKL